MQASAPSNSFKTGSGYTLKSFMIRTFSFGSLLTESGRLLRDSAMIEVMVGLRRHCVRTSLPMKPVQPVRMNFMLIKSAKNQMSTAR